jgi:thiol-disulfide isomerase/thioredoxin
MHQEPSTRSFNDYNLVGKSFDGSQEIKIAGIDCGKYRHFCLSQNVYELPTVRIYCNTTMEQYDGGFSYQSINKWAANISGASFDEKPLLVALPNSKTFKKMKEDYGCVLASFETPWCPQCHRFKTRMNRLARLFANESSIGFAVIDVDRYRDFLREYETLVFPDIRLFVRGEKKPIEYTDHRKVPNVVEFINNNCGTRVSVNDVEGELGLNDDANQLAEDFFDNNRKPVYIQEMRSKRGLENYVYVFDGIQQHGDQWLDQEMQRLKNALNDDGLKQKDKDDMTKKVNIISYIKELIKYKSK